MPNPFSRRGLAVLSRWSVFAGCGRFLSILLRASGFSKFQVSSGLFPGDLSWKADNWCNSGGPKWAVISTLLFGPGQLEHSCLLENPMCDLRWEKSPIANRLRSARAVNSRTPIFHMEGILDEKRPIARFESQCKTQGL